MQDNANKKNVPSVSGQRRKTVVLPSGIEATVLGMDTSTLRILTNLDLINKGEQVLEAFTKQGIIESIGSDTLIDKEYIARMSDEDVNTLYSAIRDASYKKKTFVYSHDWADEKASKREIVKHTISCEFDDYQIRYATPDGSKPETLLSSYSEVPDYKDIETEYGTYRVSRIMYGNMLRFRQEHSKKDLDFFFKLDLAKPRKLENGKEIYLSKEDIGELPPDLSVELLSAIERMHGAIDTNVEISHLGKKTQINVLNTPNFLVPIKM